MKNVRILIYAITLFVLAIFWFVSDSQQEEDDFTSLVNVSLRAIGNSLLLAHDDATSRVMPIAKTTTNTYRLSFEKNLAIEPGQLVKFVGESFDKAGLPNHYIIEVVACVNREVVYSSLFRNEKEKSIVTCQERVLPEDCYAIDVRFKNREAAGISRRTIGYFILLLLVIVGIDFIRSAYKTKVSFQGSSDSSDAEQRLGIFVFYPEQLLLVKEAQEIQLSKKECELLSIFAERPNQVVTREELTKKVWEDNGVFVGRSLDTYISKLRKKLQDDGSIKITNVHGVGYKLELT